MDADPLIGTRVGNYQIVALLGEGGMARVYTATHLELGKKVAIKVLSAQVAAMPDVVRRFRVEAQTVSNLDHGNIIDIFDFGTLPDGRLYYLMELLAGESLADHIRRIGALALGEALAITDAVLDALDAIHRAGIVHRDLKPDNVYLAHSGGKRVIKVLDFGIVKLLGDAGFDKTQTGALLGTPSYMAPEQCEGRIKDIGPRTDIYAVGCMLYQMLSGVLPFNAESLGGLLLQHMTEAPRPLTERIRGLPAALSQLVANCLAKDPAQRPANAGWLRDQLRPFVAQGAALSAAETIAAQAPGAPHAVQTVVSQARPPAVAAPAVPVAQDEPRTTMPMSSMPTPPAPQPPAAAKRWPFVAGGAVVAIAAAAIVLVVRHPAAVAPADARMDSPKPRPDAAIDAPVDAAIDAPVDGAIDARPDGPPTLKERLEALKRMCDDHVFPADECKTKRDELMREWDKEQR